MEMSGQLHALAALRPGKKKPVHIQEVVGGAPETVWAMWINVQVTS